MQSDFSELFERLRLCRSRSRKLEVDIGNLESVSLSHWVEYLDQPGTGTVNAKLLEHPPVRLRQEVGMLVNEQRSILDALACKLAVRNGANNWNDVYFPISKDRASFLSDGRKKIRKLSDSDRCLIETFRPWLPTDRAPEDGNLTLFQLHEADKFRKHQDLLRWACLGGVEPTGNGIIGLLQVNRVIFNEVGREERLALFANITCNLIVNFEVVYLTPNAVSGAPVAPLLSRFNDTIESILRTFD